ncbi:processing of precursor 7, ribonuclease P family [Syncephalis fuscata]|nr:processing of precursor 7, ribonuclease P family [Syncephalis fuscata]
MSTQSSSNTPFKIVGTSQVARQQRAIQGRIAKRAPQRAATKPNDIYVTRKSSFHGQLARAKKLLASNEAKFDTIVIHGLGAAIGRAIELATAIETSMHHQVSLQTTTSTVTLVDDIYPKDQVGANAFLTRHNNCQGDIDLVNGQ